ncbi:Uncharacterised protein [Klebsiella pneumoniae]|nr:Uncharacterised protein [Klebsiella pneumoniae]
MSLRRSCKRRLKPGKRVCTFFIRITLPAQQHVTHRGFCTLSIKHSRCNLCRLNVAPDITYWAMFIKFSPEPQLTGRHDIPKL